MQQFQNLPFPLVRKKGGRLAAGFRQGRAPVLRAPEGSLDEFRRKQHNARKREWAAISLKSRRHFYFAERRHFYLAATENNARRGARVWLLPTTKG
jgi:hypothetical protein